MAEMSQVLQFKYYKEWEKEPFDRQALHIYPSQSDQGQNCLLSGLIARIHHSYKNCNKISMDKHPLTEKHQRAARCT
jgi:hypothetical protein